MALRRYCVLVEDEETTDNDWGCVGGESAGSDGGGADGEYSRKREGQRPEEIYEALLKTVNVDRTMSYVNL